MSERDTNGESPEPDEKEGMSEVRDIIVHKNAVPSGGFGRLDLFQHGLDDFSNLEVDAEKEWFPIGPQPLTVMPPLQIGTVQFAPKVNFSGRGPNAGEVTDIAIDPTGAADQTIYIAAGSGGIWKTTDGGSTWSPKGDFLRTLSMGAVAIDPTDNHVVYAGTGNLFDPGRVYTKGVGLYKSIDGGETWAHVDGGVFATVLANAGINRILVLASNVVMVATYHGLFRSVDGGLNFGDNAPNYNNGVPMLHGQITSLTRDTLDSEVVYAAASGYGIFRLKDKGATFDRNLFRGQFEAAVSARFANLPAGHYEPDARKGQFGNIAFAQSTLDDHGQPDNKLMYASVQFTPVNQPAVYIGLFKSEDSGQTWLTVLQAKPRIDSDGAGQTTDNLTVGIDPQTPGYIYVGSQELWTSTDGGTNFPNVPGMSGEIHFDQHALVFRPRSHWENTMPIRVYVGTDGGVARCDSFGGNQWDNLNSGVGTNLVRGIAIGRGAGNNDFTYCAMHDNGTAVHHPTDKPLEWQVRLAGDSFVVAVDPADPQIAYGFLNENFAKTANGGAIWFTTQPVAQFPAIVTIKDASVASPIVITTDVDHPYMSRDSVTVRNVLGNVAANGTWTITRKDSRHFSLDNSTGTVGAVSSGGFAMGPSVGRGLRNPAQSFIRRVALKPDNSPPDARVVYVSEDTTLYKSTDAGITFTLLKPFEDSVTAIATTPLDSNRLWIGLKNGKVHYSADGGSSWDVAPFNSTPGGVGAVDEVAVDPTTVNRVAVVFSGFSGINSFLRTQHCFLTSDNGQKWNDISGTDGVGPKGNLPDIPLHSAVWDKSTNPPTLIVASDAGVLRSADLGASWKVMGVNLPSVSCQSLAIDDSVTPPVLRVGTYGRSCFELRKNSGPRLAISADLGFGAVAFGQSAELPLILYNAGDAPLQISDVSRTSGLNDFQIVSPPAMPLSIDAGFKAPLKIRFQPSGIANQLAVFRVQSNDATVPSALIPASGWGAVAPATPRLAVNANLNFGTVRDSAGRELPLHIINTGLADLHISNIRRSDGNSDFELASASSFPVVISPGSDLNLAVRFKPTSNGNLEAEFQIQSDDPRGARTINAIGTGATEAGISFAAIVVILGLAAAVVIGVPALIDELKHR